MTLNTRTTHTQKAVLYTVMGCSSVTNPNGPLLSSSSSLMAKCKLPNTPVYELISQFDMGVRKAVCFISLNDTRTFPFPDIINDVIMSTMASQITSLTIVYSTVYSGPDQRKTSKLRITGLCEGNSPMTGESRAQRASHAENVSIWWRHHDVEGNTKNLSIPS